MLYIVTTASILALAALLLGAWTRFLIVKHIWDPHGIIKKKHLSRIACFSIAFACVMLLLFIPNSQNTSAIRTAHILFLVDSSKSMGAERPLGSKNRIDRSEEIIRSICGAYPDIHTALYAFTITTRSHAYFPGSSDNIKNCGYIEKTLDNVLTVESVPQQGSDIAGALSMSASAFPKEAKSRVLILFSDGEYTEGDKKFIQAFSEIKRGEIRLIIVGVGEENGAFIPVYNPKTGNIISLELTYTDKNVVTYLRTETLRTIAKEGRGKYFNESDRETILYEIDKNLVIAEEESPNFYSTWKLVPLSVLFLASFLFLKSIT